MHLLATANAGAPDWVFLLAIGLALLAGYFFGKRRRRRR
jgi:LPXTG-motif cell wall-anchored protein